MKFDYNAEYFNPEHVLECGQTFRFSPYKNGYLVNSADKICYVYTDGDVVPKAQAMFVRTYIE